MGFSNPLNKNVLTVKVANGTADSEAIYCAEQTLSAVITPAALTNSGMRFKGSVDGSTYVDIYDDTPTRYSITVATGASNGYDLNLAKMKPWPWVKINMSGNEGAERSFTVLLTGV